MSEQFLNLELRLLILQYGRQRIIDTLAQLGNQTQEDVERELSVALEGKARHQKPKARTTSDLIANACRDRPEVTERVTKLVNQFENRMFLPHLRDVVRFLDRASVAHGKLKSRRASAPKLIDALAKLNVEELQRLAATPTAEGESDFAILAREIMSGGRPRRSPKNEY